MVMTSKFKDHVAAERRLAILQTLAESVGYQANEYTLEALLEDLALGVSNARLRADLAHLAELGLLETNGVGGVTIAHLTRAGLDAAAGKSQVPGVARPRPE